ncbi:hypothetical protein BKA67DRAFT_591540 [Truncatella angustata]|uniref:FAD-binding PCMH-type domain-containing protein n=1 Tax=Truncatella angustata TaxID=152316 RepID=A0A9P8UV19_9PEZI|nr:uncharacterized protein BKA67DRAFT_591540 [Truncatella angustata]KAH6658719.1 hypothetical protein BKA67DRAFT_591540 [Truncatella angustata]
MTSKIFGDTGLGHIVLISGDADYDARVYSYWSSSAKLKPACIVLPKNAQEVSSTIKSLVPANERFAIRSEGHTNWPGSNNIQNGVTVDLSFLNRTRVSSDLKTVEIGPSARWRDVSVELHESKLAVAGGREGNIGVAGLLLGGGYNFLTGRQGFACDNVIDYDFALADGRIVTANTQSNADLFRSLKGRSNNFGVVTKFTMTTIPCDKALAAFADNVRKDSDCNLVSMVTYLPDFKDIIVATLFNQILNTVKMTTVADMAFEYNVPAGYHDIWFTAYYKNDRRIIKNASELHVMIVHLVKDFAPDGDFMTQCIFQPLPKLFSEQSAKAGGNIMGTERHAYDGILWLATVMVKPPEQEALAYPKVKAWVEDVKDYASTIDGGNLEWTYPNYAGPSQNPLRSYGTDNLKAMQDVAAKYNPNGYYKNYAQEDSRFPKSGYVQDV